MLQDLEDFDVETVSRTTLFDRTFILSALVEWYGILEAFSAHVRGPLREELAQMVSPSRTPISYCVVCLTISLQLDTTAALLRAGAPTDILQK